MRATWRKGSGLACLGMAAAFTFSIPVAVGSGFEFGDGDRTVILGNSFAERMQYYGYFEALLQYRTSRLRIVLRNMGWSGDEVGLMPRPLNFEGGAGDLYANDTGVGYDVPRSIEVDFKMLKAHLSARKADTLVLCFGANEAFAGEEGLDGFAERYQVLIDQLLSVKFNGRLLPRLILVSPIPQENLGAPFHDPTKHNAVLARYAERVGEIARRNKLYFVDIFATMGEAMSAPGGKPMTIDGLQLNARGQELVAELLCQGLGLGGEWSAEFEPLRRLVVEKDRQFFYRWRPINGEYVFGRRKEPFGVITFPPEMAQLDAIVEDLDEKIHGEARRLGAPE